MEISPPPEPTPTPAPAPDPIGPRRIVCDFCKCQLAADGGVLKSSQIARDFANLDDNLQRALSDVRAAHDELARVTADLAAANAKAKQLADDLQARATEKPWYRRGE